MFKDIISQVVKSNVMDTFMCAQCSASYVGESTCHFYTRVSEHRGLSPHTGLPTRTVPKSNAYKHFLETGHEIHLENVKVLHCVYRGNLKCCYPAKVQLVVRLPPGRRGVLSPNHVTPIFFDILDLKDSEKFGMTFWAYSYLLENLKKV